MKFKEGDEVLVVMGRRPRTPLCGRVGVVIDSFDMGLGTSYHVGMGTSKMSYTYLEDELQIATRKDKIQELETQASHVERLLGIAEKRVITAQESVREYEEEHDRLCLAITDLMSSEYPELSD